MNRHDLDEKRLKPCVADLYANSKGPTTKCYPQSFDTWRNHGVCGMSGNDAVYIVPMDCYYCDRETMKAIVEKWCKGLHGFWYYIPKLTHGEPGYEEHVKELHDFRAFEEKVSNDKTLTYAQRAAKIKKEALAHNFMWRSRDKEYISHNVWLGVSPNSNEEWVSQNHIVYNAIEAAAQAGKLKNLYTDYTRTREFIYIKDGTALHARMENVSYWYEGTRLMSREMGDRETCNLYNDAGEYVDNLWNHENIRRLMSAATLENMIQEYLPVIVETLKLQGHDEEAEWILNNDKFDRSNLKQCLAVWIMSQWWQEEQR